MSVGGAQKLHVGVGVGEGDRNDLLTAVAAGDGNEKMFNGQDSLQTVLGVVVQLLLQLRNQRGVVVGVVVVVVSGVVVSGVVVCCCDVVEIVESGGVGVVVVRLIGNF